MCIGNQPQRCRASYSLITAMVYCRQTTAAPGIVFLSRADVLLAGVEALVNAAQCCRQALRPLLPLSLIIDIDVKQSFGESWVLLLSIKLNRLEVVTKEEADCAHVCDTSNQSFNNKLAPNPSFSHTHTRTNNFNRQRYRENQS